MKSRNLLKQVLGGAAIALAASLVMPASAADMPGKGVKVQPIKSSIAEETFQTLLVMHALTDLGYDVQPIKEIEYAAGHIALGNGDATLYGRPLESLACGFL